MSRVPRVVEPQPYRFLGTRPCARDSAGIVHAVSTFKDSAPYFSRTHCTSLIWHLVEPVELVEGGVVSCLECMGSADVSR